MEAPPGFEPGMEVLQTSALPLGDGALWRAVSQAGEFSSYHRGYGCPQGSHDCIGREAPSWRPLGPYIYGIMVCMKKTFHVSDALLREARAACGATTDTDTIRLGLEALIRHAAYERLRALRGAEPGARDVRRRRERPAARKHAAA